MRTSYQRRQKEARACIARQHKYKFSRTAHLSQTAKTNKHAKVQLQLRKADSSMNPPKFGTIPTWGQISQRVRMTSTKLGETLLDATTAQHSVKTTTTTLFCSTKKKTRDRLVLCSPWRLTGRDRTSPGGKKKKKKRCQPHGHGERPRPRLVEAVHPTDKCAPPSQVRDSTPSGRLLTKYTQRECTRPNTLANRRESCTGIKRRCVACTSISKPTAQSKDHY